MSQKEQKEFEEKVVELNLLNARMQELEQQMQIIEKQISELHTVYTALKELEETNTETEMLSSIGQNVFVKAKLQDNQEVCMDVGAKVFVKKTVQEAKDIITKKTDEFIDIRENATKQLQFIAEQMLTLENDLRKEQSRLSRE
ncbi:MAG: prefoldin subunit alpha [Candidatus Pacearchaeota archaeon]|nr:prefoldin subunit alpha [Candidatus Pacearchaeota archaeon]